MKAEKRAIIAWTSDRYRRRGGGDKVGGIGAVDLLWEPRLPIARRGPRIQPLPLTSGNSACCHAAMPPSNTWTRSKPALFSRLAAPATVMPL
jgi:hypothetical protein